MNLFYVVLRNPADVRKIREAFPARKVWIVVSPTLLLSAFTEREQEMLLCDFSHMVTLQPASPAVVNAISV